MFRRSLCEVPLVPPDTEGNQEEIVASLDLIDTAELTEEQAQAWESAMSEFLYGLSDESYNRRFKLKPETVLKRYLRNQEQPLKVLVLHQDEKIIAACTIADYPIHDPAYEYTDEDGIVDREHVVEFSETVADAWQGRTIGRRLLETAGRVATEEGKEYAYATFDSDNKAIKSTLDKVFGYDNLVTRRTNQEERFYRLPWVKQPVEDYDRSLLEHTMVRICSAEPIRPIEKKAEPPEVETTRERVARVGRQVFSVSTRDQ